jgi:hypothetical protein
MIEDEWIISLDSIEGTIVYRYSKEGIDCQLSELTLVDTW